MSIAQWKFTKAEDPGKSGLWSQCGQSQHVLVKAYIGVLLRFI